MPSPLDQADPPRDQADPSPGSGRHPPPGPGRPLPGKQTPAYGLRAAGTHPTGMHSCYLNIQDKRKTCYTSGISVRDAMHKCL